MVILALVAATTAAAEPQPTTRVAPAVQARATVRIVSGVRVKFGEEVEDAQLRTTQVRDSDGNMKEARLVEFQ